MISKKRFEQLQSGDFIITESPKGKQTIRKIVSKSRFNCIRVEMCYFKNETTVYNYSDIGKKIIAIIKIKQWKKEN
ncbi:hypothetical protein LIT13_06670 [Flavobacterium psychrophilum]|uniref:hypothetical protein n=1 Tax=Flavobacterium psychrophilum TaxID=96345 RepID=UPI0014647BE8|nr:hypothetical protein [Flavobacterium psychrophilum]MCB5972668.1 hypothetical protein [Flavobacterium psychrophilum]MCB5978999.1 hypothetical protein [Flavobacterium psychrophilum]MCB5983279.1 hypothetical protein [Flavobacterium psychrophilum]QCW20373.1 hypothetical protein [Flavobacterium phage FPSV-S2]